MNSTILTWPAVLLTSLLVGMPISTNARELDSFSWYVGTDLGLMQSWSQELMTVPNGSSYPSPGNRDQYSVNQPQPILFDIQIGRRFYRDKQWIPSYALALRYEHVFTKNIVGMVTQYSDPEFTNYSYTWGVSSDVISLYAKFDLVRYGLLMPYIDVGLGRSFNQSHTYNETTLPSVMTRNSPDYASHTNQQFAYNVGIGLDFILTRKLLLSAGYSYHSFGNQSSGFGQGSNWSNTQLMLGKFYSNVGSIGISYLF